MPRSVRSAGSTHQRPVQQCIVNLAGKIEDKRIAQGDVGRRLAMEKRQLDECIVGTACSSCGREFKRTMAWCRTHGTIECPCGGRIRVEYETLKQMLAPGIQGGHGGLLEIEAAFKEIEDELGDYARDHPNLGDQELQRHAFKALTNRLGREWISLSSGSTGEVEVVFEKDG